MAVQAELKGLDSTDIADQVWEEWRPDDPDCFALSVTASVGAAGEEGADLFDFVVCTPSWVQTDRLQKGFAFSRYLLITRWDPDLVERAIRDLCRRTRGEDWPEVARKLSRYSSWEFDEYSP